MKSKSIVFFAIAIFMFFQSSGQDLTENSFGNGLINVVARDSSYSAKFAVRFQPLFSSFWNISSNENAGNDQTNFLIRRARLKFDGFVYSPRLLYKVELGLSNRDISGATEFTGDEARYLLDAVARWNFYENFELWAGQTKLPGNRERLISSGDLETVDRSLVNSRFNIDRDIGFQIHHFFRPGKQFLVREIFSFSQGEGRNVISGNFGGYQYSGKLELLPFGDFEDYEGADLVREPSPKLSIGLSYEFNDNAVRSRSNMGSYMRTAEGFFETDISTLFLDFIFKYQGISVMSEFAHRDADSPVAINLDGTPTGDRVNTGNGFNFQAGYLFRNNIQIIGRYTEINEDFMDPLDMKSQYTFGISKYIVGHKLKVQTDISYNDFLQDEGEGLLYRLQFEVHL